MAEKVLSFVGSTVFECEQTVRNLSYHGKAGKCAELTLWNCTDHTTSGDSCNCKYIRSNFHHNAGSTSPILTILGSLESSWNEDNSEPKLIQESDCCLLPNARNAS